MPLACGVRAKKDDAPPSPRGDASASAVNPSAKSSTAGPPSRLKPPSIVRAKSAPGASRGRDPSSRVPAQDKKCASKLDAPSPRTPGRSAHSSLSRERCSRGASAAKQASSSLASPKKTGQSSSLASPRRVGQSSSSMTSPKKDGCRPSSSIGRNASTSPTSTTHPRDTSIKVCMRVRPMSQKEQARGEEHVVLCTPQCPTSLFIMVPGGARAENGKVAEGNKSEHKFDWVVPGETSQARVYELVGVRAVQGATNGFHSCIFAYGHTGSGKSYSIFGGNDEERGLLPRIIEGLFSELANASQDSYMVRLSYLELYNESARDLLHPGNATGEMPHLEIRQHPQQGVFVENLTLNVVETVWDVLQLLDFGNKMRVVGCTNMNAVSSRSHALVTLNVELADGSAKKGCIKKQRARLHAVDLAGSERLKNSEASEQQLKEGRNINKSLLALGIMISQLAAGKSHISFRESKLTLLLADSLMGNCRTTLLACASPAGSLASMTEATVRFANSVKKIRTKPVKNEEAEGVLIESLLAEIQSLKKELQDAEAEKQREIQERIAATQGYYNSVDVTWSEERESSRNFQHKRRMTLLQLGLAEDGNQDHPYLMNDCADPLLAGCLKYRLLSKDAVLIGSDESSCAIVINGLGVQSHMCSVRASADMKSAEVTLPEIPEEERRASRRGSLFKCGTSEVCINGKLVQGKVAMEHGDRLQVGSTHVFKLVVPSARGANNSQDQTVAPSVGQNQEYMAHLQERVGVKKAGAILSAVSELQVQVKEANSITRELLGLGASENMFKAHVLIDISTEEEDPKLAVGVYHANNHVQADQEAIWSVLKFRQRLEAMRDIYQAVSDRELPWGRVGDACPWSDRDGIPVLEVAVTPSENYPCKAQEANSITSSEVAAPIEPVVETSVISEFSSPKTTPQPSHRADKRASLPSESKFITQTSRMSSVYDDLQTTRADPGMVASQGRSSLSPRERSRTCYGKSQTIEPLSKHRRAKSLTRTFGR